ncbi:heterokaryon incompatibility 6 OR allele [Fusarium subglutinans]|uniref:Heterokaryon incompatibility 6 OR allele n=1 Tax=Gibberella subglutinans TaxID=42677 RepID=A0A8H5PQN6_GIBSU|nr:heterokaryon incompatibility 6 OR allele [Fusarium subglutinans]KAF5601570.1 heterokaryon incompatibility 6 OR allele [Fusarium subglutinans]
MWSSLTRKGYVPLLSLNSRTLRATSPRRRPHGPFDSLLLTFCFGRRLSYKYDTRLGRDCIRIFTLDPGNKCDELRGTLQTHLLNAAPKYEALRYVWGPRKQTKSIKYNGQDFSITDSLDTALRRLRLSGKPRHNSSNRRGIYDREPDQRRYLELVRLAAEAIPLPVEPCWTSPEDFEFLERMLKALYPHDLPVVAADLEMLSRVDCDFVMGPQRFEELVQASHDSKMFVMETGYVGFGPRCMRPGDIVCVLFGGRTPYVIRPTAVADEYLFLGPAYVHGLMDGEAIDAWEKGKWTENQDIQERLFKLL